MVSVNSFSRNLDLKGVLRCLDNRRVHCLTQYQHEVQEDVAAWACIIELSKFIDTSPLRLAIR